jgi:hypothetical protein
VSLLSLRCARSRNIASRDSVQNQAVLALPVLDGVLCSTVPFRTVLWQPCVGTGRRRPQRLDRLIILPSMIPHPPSAALSLLGGGSSDGDSNHSNHSNHSASPRPTRWWSGRRYKDSRIAGQRQRPTLPAAPLPGPPWPWSSFSVARSGLSLPPSARAS